MALKTLGTLATTSLQGFQAPPKYNATPGLNTADIATLNAAIWDDSRNPQQLLNQQPMNTAFGSSSTLYIPNRGILQVHAGDWICYDQSGWPILIGKESLPQTLTVTGTASSGTTAVTALSANVLTQGWWAGMLITGGNLAAGTFISAIAANGLSLTLSKNATGSGAGTLTAGSWTHS